MSDQFELKRMSAVMRQRVKERENNIRAAIALRENMTPEEIEEENARLEQEIIDRLAADNVTYCPPQIYWKEAPSEKW